MKAKKGFFDEKRADNTIPTPFLLQTRNKDIIPSVSEFTETNMYPDFRLDLGTDDYSINIDQMGIADIHIKAPLSTFYFAPSFADYSWKDRNNDQHSFEIINNFPISLKFVDMLELRGYFNIHGGSTANPNIYNEPQCSTIIPMNKYFHVLDLQPIFAYRPPYTGDEHPEDIGWWKYNYNGFYKVAKSSSLVRVFSIPTSLFRCENILYADATILNKSEISDSFYHSFTPLVGFGSLTPEPSSDSNWSENTITNAFVCTIEQSDTTTNLDTGYGVTPDGKLNKLDFFNNIYVEIHIITCVNEKLHTDDPTKVEPMDY